MVTLLRESLYDSWKFSLQRWRQRLPAHQSEDGGCDMWQKWEQTDLEKLKESFIFTILGSLLALLHGFTREFEKWSWFGGSTGRYLAAWISNQIIEKSLSCPTSEFHNTQYVQAVTR